METLTIVLAWCALFAMLYAGAMWLVVRRDYRKRYPKRKAT